LHLLQSIDMLDVHFPCLILLSLLAAANILPPFRSLHFHYFFIIYRSLLSSALILVANNCRHAVP